jgi:hypothetical protein
MQISPGIPFLASLPVLEWSSFLNGPNPCRRQALASPLLSTKEWAILRPLFLLALDRGKVPRELGKAVALLFDLDHRAPLVRACEEEWRSLVRLGGALAQYHSYSGNQVASRLAPFVQWHYIQVPGGCAHGPLGGHVIPHGSPLLPLYWPPLSEVCACYLSTISLAKARRARKLFALLAEASVLPLVAPLWLGELAPVAAPEASCLELLAQGEAMLAERGIVWKKAAGVSGGLRLGKG